MQFCRLSNLNVHSTKSLVFYLIAFFHMIKCRHIISITLQLTFLTNNLSPLQNQINVLHFFHKMSNKDYIAISSPRFNSTVFIIIFCKTSAQMPLCNIIQTQSQMIHSQMASQHNSKNENKRYSFTRSTKNGVARHEYIWQLRHYR